MKYWQDKPYNTLNAYCKDVIGEKLYKTSFDIGLTCPNRDGKIDTRGCIFCSAGGSGDFAKKIAGDTNTITKEIYEHLNQLDNQKKYIGYFQAFTNTYGNKEYLKACYNAALSHKSIMGISIGTRPDCIDKEIIEIIVELRKKHNKFIWIELGFQTMHKETIDYIRRGYDNNIFNETISILKAFEIPVVIHLIIGLPGETKEMILETVKYVNKYKPFGIKLQLLHVLEETDLAKAYLNNKFQLLTQDEYIDIIIQAIELLDESVVIHRVTGDGDKTKLIGPKWSSNKKSVLNQLHKTMKQRKTYQGIKIK